MENNKKNIGKSIWAVIAGFLTVVILSIATDTILEHTGILPPIASGVRMTTGMLALALAYRCIFTVIGGYITAKLAPEPKMKHVKVLAIIGLFAGIAGVFAGWNLSDHWYPIAIAITAVPLTMLGGRIFTRNMSAAARSRQ